MRGRLRTRGVARSGARATGRAELPLALAIVLFALSAAGAGCRAPRRGAIESAPASAAAIAPTRIETLRAQFNRDQNSVRVIAILSPT